MPDPLIPLGAAPTPEAGQDERRAQGAPLSAMPPGSVTEPWADPLTAEDHARLDAMRRHRDEARVRSQTYVVSS